MDYFPAWRSDLVRWQERIRLSASHRYSVENQLTGKWDYVPGVTGAILSTKSGVENLSKWAAEKVEEEALRRLTIWAKDGYKGSPEPYIEGVWEAANKAKNVAQKAGTQMHALFERECRIRMGENPPEIPITDAEQKILDKFKRFADTVQLRPVAVESRVYHAPINGMWKTSEFAGTFDLLTYSNLSPDLEIWDYKGKEKAQSLFWESEALQSSAYRSAISQMLKIPPPGGRIVYYPRPGQTFEISHVRVSTPLVDTFAAFLSMLSIAAWNRDVFRKTQKEKAA